MKLLSNRALWEAEKINALVRFAVEAARRGESVAIVSRTVAQAKDIERRIRAAMQAQR